jgi:hypothetical protein
MAPRVEDDVAEENGQEKDWEFLELTVMGAIIVSGKDAAPAPPSLRKILGFCLPIP